MRKRRTRQHIIEDLGFNHIERHILIAGYTMYCYDSNDYGYDGLIQFFDENSEIENVIVQFQLKSSDNFMLTKDSTQIVFDLSKSDLELWLLNSTTVLLTLYDAKKDESFFIELQDYFKKNRIDLKNVRKFVRVYVPKSQLFTTESIISLRQKIKGA
jgi:hypothetical protein